MRVAVRIDDVTTPEQVAAWSGKLAALPGVEQVRRTKLLSRGDVGLFVLDVESMPGLRVAIRQNEELWPVAAVVRENEAERPAWKRRRARRDRDGDDD